MIERVVERVFRSVAAVRDDLVAGYRAAGGRMCDSDVTAVREALIARLVRERSVAVGMGVIVAPGLLVDRPLRMEWWQADTEAAPVMLEVDLNPASVGFYDYAAAEWFTVPRRTGRRHVVGPYVDVHGTDRYLLTLTLPVLADGRFVGVAGADVPVARFETLVLRELGDLAADVVVVNVEDRVVLSTSPRWLVGDRAVLTDAPCRALDEPDWRVVVT
ncbi:cache domain-containing protein [Pseudonocardia oroxyli]|uniref:Cache domain-containing protein n=1 Tax=Pseudonocardia oroxyli TaxID=366584 RepID=A0A1G7FVG8_PSEOR|nr:cache domain-containing protein [Pseudonocardia oroxyli]SDE79864.1 hypothetical protein SAMN05216377_102116 [Pseudonocardia oroxyli]